MSVDSGARTVVVGRDGPPRRADARPCSISTVQLAMPPAVNSSVAVTSASRGE